MREERERRESERRGNVRPRPRAPVADSRVAGASGTLSRGADIALAAAVDIVLDANLNADGGLAGGGSVDLQVGNDLIANADINASSVESGGSGGQLSVSTGRDIVICHGCKVLLNGHFGRGGGGRTASPSRSSLPPRGRTAARASSTRARAACRPRPPTSTCQVIHPGQCYKL